MTDQRPLVMHVIHRLATGGMENGLVNLINRLPRDQWRHAIACVEDASDFRERIRRDDVELFELHRSRIGVWRLRRALFGLCRRLKPAIVHSRNLSGLDALVPSWLAGVPHRVHGEHGWEVSDLTGTRPRSIWLRRLHAPWVQRWVAVSRDLERYLAQRVGIAGTRIEQITNGVDTERFAPAGPRHSPAVLPSGFEGPQRLRIGTVGRLQPVKDQATLIDAFAAMLRAQPALGEQSRLIVVGGGALEGSLRERAASAGIAPQVWFAGERSDVPELLRCFDLFVLPSLNEGISNTMLEAMASGVPVLASAVGGNAELVQQGINGALFPAGDTAALQRHLTDLTLDSERRRRYATAARLHAVRQFGIESMVGRYAQVYRDLLRRASN